VTAQRVKEEENQQPCQVDVHDSSSKEKVKGMVLTLSNQELWYFISGCKICSFQSTYQSPYHSQTVPRVHHIGHRKKVKAKNTIEGAVYKLKEFTFIQEDFIASTMLQFVPVMETFSFKYIFESYLMPLLINNVYVSVWIHSSNLI